MAGTSPAMTTMEGFSEEGDSLALHRSANRTAVVLEIESRTPK